MASKQLDNYPKQEISIQEALNSAWAKVGQLIWEIDILRQQVMILETENKELKSKAK